METKQALSATDKICHPQEIDKQLGSAVIGTPLGIAPNATRCIMTARMRRFVTYWDLLDVPERKHVIRINDITARTSLGESQKKHPHRHLTS